MWCLPNSISKLKNFWLWLFKPNIYSEHLSGAYFLASFGAGFLSVCLFAGFYWHEPNIFLRASPLSNCLILLFFFEWVLFYPMVASYTGFFMRVSDNKWPARNSNGDVLCMLFWYFLLMFMFIVCFYSVLAEFYPLSGNSSTMVSSSLFVVVPGSIYGIGAVLKFSVSLVIKNLNRKGLIVLFLLSIAIFTLKDVHLSAWTLSSLETLLKFLGSYVPYDLLVCGKGTPMKIAMDLFSSFDDHNKVCFDAFYIVWLVMLLIVLLMNETKFFTMGFWFSSKIILSYVSFSLVKTTKLNNISGSLGVISSLFMMIIIMNFQGILPYTLGLTSHLVVALCLALPLWASIVLMSTSFSFSSFLAHLLPAGSPAYLNPFLCLIELVSMMIRPLTLTVRVVANLSTGHILISLLATGCMGSSGFTFFFIIIVGSLYMLFEMAVCLVQAYIFTLLPTLYGDEHPTN